MADNNRDADMNEEDDEIEEEEQVEEDEQGSAEVDKGDEHERYIGTLALQ
jgi:hypothetical protein